MIAAGWGQLSFSTEGEVRVLHSGRRSWFARVTEARMWSISTEVGVLRFLRSDPERVGWGGVGWGVEVIVFRLELVR